MLISRNGEWVSLLLVLFRKERACSGLEPRLHHATFRFPGANQLAPPRVRVETIANARR